MEKQLYTNLLDQCKKIVSKITPADEPASNMEAVNGNPTTQPPPPIGDIENATPLMKRNTSNNGEEMEGGLSKILRILTSCEQKVKIHLDDFEAGRLDFKKFADEIFDFKTFIAASARIKPSIASAKDKINALIDDASNVTEIEMQQFVDFKKKLKKHKQALIYIAEIGKWCKRNQNKTEKKKNWKKIKVSCWLFL